MYRSNRIVVEAPAKINLFLDITGRLENGYHCLDTVMQAVDLADAVIIGRNSGGGIRVTCSRADLPDGPANLAYRAAAAFFAATGLPQVDLHLHIDKAIPTEAGMGGGSSDAAAVLVGLNELFGTGLSPERLREIGVSIGADVPFLIEGGCARAEGIGEKLTPLFPGLRPCWLAVAKPERGVSTRDAFAAYDVRQDLVHRPSEELRIALATADLAWTAARLFNVFEQLIEVPGPEQVKSVMHGRGALGSLMTGSGSAVYGVFAERDAAEACRSALTETGIKAYLARPVGYGARIVHKS